MRREVGEVRVPEVSVAEARGRTQGGAVLLDVREPDEWAAGHAPEARHVPLGMLGERLDDLAAEAEILVICRSGGRSLTAATALAHAGFSSLNVAGGMQSWESAGLPVVTDDGGPGTVL